MNTRIINIDVLVKALIGTLIDQILHLEAVFLDMIKTHDIFFGDDTGIVGDLPLPNNFISAKEGAAVIDLSLIPKVCPAYEPGYRTGLRYVVLLTALRKMDLISSYAVFHMLYNTYLENDTFAIWIDMLSAYPSNETMRTNDESKYVLMMIANGSFYNGLCRIKLSRPFISGLDAEIRKMTDEAVEQIHNEYVVVSE